MTWNPQFDGWSATVKAGDIDVEHTRTHEWTFRRTTREWDLSIPVSTYEYCSKRHRVQEYGTYISDPVQRSMLEPLCDRFKRFADKKSLSDRSLLRAIVRFIQSFPYILDSEDTGHRTYPKYPAEMFIHGQGDCEDGTILLGSVLDILDYDVAVIVFPAAQHMLLGVALEEAAGSYIEYNGVRYYTIETTDIGWDVGDLPPKYRQTGADIQLPNQAPVLVHEWKAIPATDGVVDITTQLANVGPAEAGSLTIQIEFKTRNQDIVAGDRLNPRGELLTPGSSSQYESRLSLPTDRELQGQMTIGIDGKVHDRSESEWH
jgi:hypothetical protein